MGGGSPAFGLHSGLHSGPDSGPHLGPAVARPIPYQLVRSWGGGNAKPCPTPAPAGFDTPERIHRWRLRPPPGAGRAGPAARRRGGRGFVPAGRRGVPRGAATRSLRGPGAANLPFGGGQRRRSAGRSWASLTPGALTPLMVVPAIGPVEKEGAPVMPAVAVVVGVGPRRVSIVGRGIGIGGAVGIVGRRIGPHGGSRLRLVVVVALNDALTHHGRRRAFDHNVPFAIAWPIEICRQRWRQRGAKGKKGNRSQSKPTHGMGYWDDLPWR